MSSVKVSDRGWMSKALNEINGGEERVEVELSSADAIRIATHISDLTHRMPVMELFKNVPRVPLASGTFTPDPTLVVPILAGMGAVGGAVAAVAFVAGVGVAHQYRLSFVYDMGSLLDPTDDRVTVVMQKGV